MSRLFFFIQEAFRALRRNAAPSMAAIVTTVTTVILLGVLIPVFQTAQAKSDQVRESLEFRVAVYDDATQAKGYRIVGDVAYGPVSQVASAITPVPGGVGRMTIAMLLQNTLQAFQQAEAR